MKFFKKIVELVFPSHCLYCQNIISADGLFCKDCWQKLQFITEPKCQVCCHPFELASANTNLICSSCLQTPKHFDKIIAVFVYNQIIGKVISDLKYRDSTYLAKKLARILQPFAASEIQDCDLIIAVPLHLAKLRSRKFNQSILLAQNFTKTKLVRDFLLRIKNTPAQVGLKKKQRQNNLKNAFIINPKYRDVVQGKKILLIDDVITTATTVESCAKLLKKSGAAKVTILAVAKTVF